MRLPSSNIPRQVCPKSPPSAILLPSPIPSAVIDLIEASAIESHVHAPFPWESSIDSKSSPLSAASLAAELGVEPDPLEGCWTRVRG